MELCKFTVEGNEVRFTFCAKLRGDFVIGHHGVRNYIMLYLRDDTIYYRYDGYWNTDDAAREIKLMDSNGILLGGWLGSYLIKVMRGDKIGKDDHRGYMHFNLGVFAKLMIIANSETSTIFARLMFT